MYVSTGEAPALGCKKANDWMVVKAEVSLAEISSWRDI
jgi:hypothetical protein